MDFSTTYLGCKTLAWRWHRHSHVIFVISLLWSKLRNYANMMRGPALFKFCFSSNFLMFMYILSIKKVWLIPLTTFCVLLCTCDVSIQPELLLEPIPNYWAPEVINVLELGHWQYIFTCLVEILDRNCILLPKLFWLTVRKNCLCGREKLLKFEAEGQEFWDH